MKTNWRVKLNGKGSSIIWDYPATKDDVLSSLKRHFKEVDILY